jgi:hypothetical protein
MLWLHKHEHADCWSILKQLQIKSFVLAPFSPQAGHHVEGMQHQQALDAGDMEFDQVRTSVGPSGFA